MSVERYRVFMEVVKSKSLQGAARRLNQSPSTISYTVTKLEDELGLPLFHRDRTGMQLTKQGEALLPHIEGILDSQKAIDRISADYHNKTAGTLHIGGTHMFMARVLYRLMDAFRLEYPGIEVIPVIRPIASMEQDMLTGVMDVAFKPVFSSQRLRFIHLLDSDFVFIFPQDDPRGGRKSLSFSDLEGEKFILPEYFLTYHKLRQLEEQVVTLGVPRKHILYADDIMSTISLAQNGYGIGILYTSVLPATRLFSHCVVEDFTPYPLGVAVLKAGVPPLVQTFIRFSKQYFAAHKVEM